MSTTCIPGESGVAPLAEDPVRGFQSRGAVGFPPVDVDQGLAALARRVDPMIGHPDIHALIEGFGHGEPVLAGGMDEAGGFVLAVEREFGHPERFATGDLAHFRPAVAAPVVVVGCRPRPPGWRRRRADGQGVVGGIHGLSVFSTTSFRAWDLRVPPGHFVEIVGDLGEQAGVLGAGGET